MVYRIKGRTNTGTAVAVQTTTEQPTLQTHDSSSALQTPRSHRVTIIPTSNTANFPQSTFSNIIPLTEQKSELLITRTFCFCTHVHSTTQLFLFVKKYAFLFDGLGILGK